MVTGPHRATLDDLDELVDCSGECFPDERNAGGVVARWPHCYKRTPEHLRRFLVMKDGPRIAACCAYTDQTLAVDGSELRVAGLGEVATRTAYRGKGLMTRLLQEAIKDIGEEGYALSDLGGDRVRYGRFGWERAGRKWNFEITARSLAASPPTAQHSVRPYGARPEEIEATAAIHESVPRRVKRTREQHALLLKRHGKTVRLAWDGANVAGYVVSEPTPKHGHIFVYEFGGSPDALHAILSLLSLQAAMPVRVASPWAHPANGMLFRISDSWSVSATRMWRLFDLTATLRAFAGQLGERRRTLGLHRAKPITLGVQETGERVTLDFVESGVQVRQGADAPSVIVLPRRDMVRFLLGPATPSIVAPLSPDATFLDALLPLDLTIWDNETV